MNELPYILITPIKDEIKNIPKLKETIFSQTVKPLIWIIGDGNSKDGSLQMVKELFKDYEWVHIIRQKTFFGSGYSHKNIAGNLNDCYEYAKELVINLKIKYYFVARTDAIPILSTNYFEVLIDEINKDPKLAFICGTQYLQCNNSKIRFSKMAGISNTGFNDQGVYRKDFLEEIGGFPITLSPETVLQIKAINRGWNLKLTNKTYFIKTRLGGSKIGIWNGYKLKGKVYYSLGYPFPLVLLKTLCNSIQLTPKSIAICLGYFTSYIRKEKKIEDKEVLDYFDKRLKQILLDVKKRYFG